MDGVLADFDSFHKSMIGYQPDRNVDWMMVRAICDFYLHIPPMPDMRELWDGLAPYSPIILTGLPSSVPKALANKLAWRDRYLPGAQLQACPSRNKRDYCQPGDVLIDNWHKYRGLWEAAGGVFILHTSARESLAALRLVSNPTII